MGLSKFILAACLVLTTGSITHAATVNTIFSGKINRISTDFGGSLAFPSIQIGQRLTIRMVYDDTKPTPRMISPEILETSLRVGTLTNDAFSESYQHKSQNRGVRIYDNLNGFDGFDLSTNRVVANSLNPGASFSVSSRDPSGQLFSALDITQLAAALDRDDPSVFPNLQISAIFAGTGGCNYCTVWADVDSIRTTVDPAIGTSGNPLVPLAPVPVPATLPLLGLALLGMGVFGRRRKKLNFSN